MISFAPDLSNLTQFAKYFSQAGGRSSQTYSSVDVQTQTETGLSIVTAEGDKVTLNTSASFSGSGVQYNGRGVAEGQAIHFRSNSLQGAFLSQKQITIEGDLSEQEIQDIQDIVNTVNKLRQDVASGNLEATLAHAQHIAATGTIASVDLKIQHSESLSIQQTTLQQHPEQAKSAVDGNTPNNVASQVRIPSSLDLLNGVVNAKDLNGILKALEQQVGGGDSSDIKSQGQVVGNPGKGPLFPKFLKDLNHVGRKNGESIETLSKRILSGAKKIARLAGKLQKAVDNTTNRIEKDTQKIADLRKEGKVEEADALQQRTDRRINRLGKTIERLSSRIAKTADRLNDVVDSLSQRLKAIAGQSSQAPQNSSEETPDSSKQGESITETQTPVAA